MTDAGTQDNYSTAVSYVWTGVRTNGTQIKLSRGQYARLLELNSLMRGTRLNLATLLRERPVPKLSEDIIRRWLRDFANLYQCANCGMWLCKGRMDYCHKGWVCLTCEPQEEPEMTGLTQVQMRELSFKDIEEALCSTAQGKQRCGEPEACESVQMNTLVSTAGAPPKDGGGGTPCETEYSGCYEACKSCFNRVCQHSQGWCRVPPCYQPFDYTPSPTISWPAPTHWPSYFPVSGGNIQCPGKKPN